MSQGTPSGELVIRVVAMPAETNANGDIFGGWILSQMDLGGAMLAKQYARSRVATVAIEGMTFLYPVKVGDFVSCYGSVIKRGRTSIAIVLETWSCCHLSANSYQVTAGTFTYVAIDEHGRPTPLPSAEQGS